MGQWHRTRCVLCAQNCGFEVLVADNRMSNNYPSEPHGYASAPARSMPGGSRVIIPVGSLKLKWLIFIFFGKSRAVTSSSAPNHWKNMIF